MKIFIIGSYLEKTKEEIEKNIEKATIAGIELIKKGHLPFVPQSMFAFWENKTNLNSIMKTCFSWIEECDAELTLNIGTKGGGTWQALEHAKRNSKIIFKSIKDIPTQI